MRASRRTDMNGIQGPRVETTRTRYGNSLLWRQWRALNVPGKMMHAVGGGENCGASRRKRQAHQALAGDFEIGETVGRNLHDAAGAGERGRDVQVAIHVESESLRPPQTLIKSAHRSVGIDFINAVGGAGDVQVSTRTECQVIGGDADFERGKDKDLLVASDLEDGSIAVADVETLIAIEGDPRGDTHAFRVSGHRSIRGDAIDGAVEARRHIHLTLTIEGDGSRIHHFRNEGFDGVVGIDLEDGDRNFLAAGT